MLVPNFSDDWKPSYLLTVNGAESFHTVLWILKDLSWSQNWCGLYPFDLSKSLCCILFCHLLINIVDVEIFELQCHLMYQVLVLYVLWIGCNELVGSSFLSGTLIRHFC